MATPLYELLKDLDLLDYGTSIAKETIHRLCGIVVPEIGTMAEFKAIGLAELNAIDHLRKQLMKEGKYIRGDTSGYRILLPSENADQVEKYIAHGKGKLKCARILAKSSEKANPGTIDGTRVAAQAKMWERGAAKQQEHNNLCSGNKRRQKKRNKKNKQVVHHTPMTGITMSTNEPKTA